MELELELSSGYTLVPCSRIACIFEFSEIRLPESVIVEGLPDA